MTPKEKAKELVDKFYQGKHSTLTSKQCALITVDEIIAAIKEADTEDNILRLDIQYWNDVKEEIEKL